MNKLKASGVHINFTCCILKFGNLIGFLIKKDAKIEYSNVLRIFELVLQLESNLAEICNIASIHKGKNLEHFFWKILSTFDFRPILHEKILENDDFLVFFQHSGVEIVVENKSPDYSMTVTLFPLTI